MDIKGENENKRMRLESGKETRRTRTQEAGHTQAARNKTVLSNYKAMQHGWQIKS